MSGINKTNYFILFICVSGLIALFYILFFKPEKPIEHNQIVLTIKPFTQREQQDMLKAQAQEERTLITGPLITLMNATEAEKKVLNLHEPKIQPLALQTLQAQSQIQETTETSTQNQTQNTTQTSTLAQLINRIIAKTRSASTQNETQNTAQSTPTPTETQSTAQSAPTQNEAQNRAQSAAAQTQISTTEAPTEPQNPILSTQAMIPASTQINTQLDEPTDTLTKPKIKKYRKKHSDAFVLPAPGQTH